MNKISLLIVDDHALFRAGLVSLLNTMGDFEVIGEASNGLEALQLVAHVRPDVILLDVNMPEMGGVEAVKALKERISCRIIMLTISKSERDLFGAIQAGADGYLLKNAEPEELRKAILQAAKGDAVLSPQVTRQVLNRIAEPTQTDAETELSRRELDVLQCLADGLTTQAIAANLFISENTVKTHIRHILEKLGASNRTEAVSRAVQQGLLRKGPEI